MFVPTNNLNNSPSSISFGYGKGIRELVKEDYPYCALTGKKYGCGKLRITTDHILSDHYGGASRDFNYMFVTMETNIYKGCKKLRKVISKNPEYIDNLAKYFEALLNSAIQRVQKFAKSSLETTLKELSGINSELVIK